MITHDSPLAHADVVWHSILEIVVFGVTMQPRLGLDVIGDVVSVMGTPAELLEPTANISFDASLEIVAFEVPMQALSALLLRQRALQMTLGTTQVAPTVANAAFDA